MNKENMMFFFRSNYLYVISFVIYFVLSCAFLGGRLISVILCLLFYTISIAVALSPLGEWLLRIINNARPIETRKEREYIFPLFEEIYQHAKKVYPQIPKLKLYIKDSMEVNAFATGKHSITVTKGAIETFSEEELQSIIAHEIAHIYYKHTTMRLLTIVGNGIFSVLVLITRFIQTIVDVLHSPFQTKDSTHAFLGLMFSLARLLTEVLIFVLMFFFNVTFAINSRKNEFQADQFASAIGYGEELTQALYLLQKMSLSENMKLVDKMTASHPRISKRIQKLEEAL